MGKHDFFCKPWNTLQFPGKMKITNFGLFLTQSYYVASDTTLNIILGVFRSSKCVYVNSFSSKIIQTSFK